MKNKFKIDSEVKSKVNTTYLNTLSTYRIVQETSNSIVLERKNGLFGGKYKWLTMPKTTDKLDFTKKNFICKRTKNNFSIVTRYSQLKKHPLVADIWSEGDDGMWLNTKVKEEYRDGDHYLHWWWPGTCDKDDGNPEFTKSEVVFEFNHMVRCYNTEKKSVLDTTW